MTAQPARLAFEVASVKENKSRDMRGFGIHFLPGGKLVIRNVALSVIISAAYGLPFQSDRLTDVPQWAYETSYDIEAIASAGVISPGMPSQVRDEKMLGMLRSLLEERFSLNIRREITERAVYVVLVAKRGPKLRKSEIDEKDCNEAPAQVGNPASCHSFGGGPGRGIHAEAATVKDLASWASTFAGRAVIDKTGLADLYNIQTEGWVSLEPSTPRPTGQESLEQRPTLFEIFDRLGLRLDPQRAPVENFVIERVERPSEN